MTVQMTITSGWYFLFLLAGVVLYYASPKRVQWVSLLILSLVYYYFAAKPWTILCLLAAALTAFGAGKYVACEYAVQPTKQQKIVLGLSIAAIVLIWLGFAGRDFWVTPLNSALKAGGNLTEKVSWAVPIGMGYYTAQVIGYILDCYMGICKPQKNFFKMFLFVCFFPQLTTGPISRYQQLEQIYEPHSFSYENLSFGIQRILWGLGKKLIIADRIGILLENIWSNLEIYNGYYHWFAILIYPVQMYCDFSGCMDIVLGTAELFDIKLPENFRNPFFAKNIQEFWQRWHITLGNWAKDFVMYPLLKTPVMVQLGKKCKKRFGSRMGKFISLTIGTFMVWMVMGVWHGGVKYIVGVSLFYWIFLTLGDLMAPYMEKVYAFLHIKTDTFSFRLTQSVKTYCIYAVGALFFRAATLKEAFLFLAGLISMFWKGEANPWIWVDGSLNQLGLDYKDMQVLIYAVLIVLGVDLLSEYLKEKTVRQWIAEQNLIFRWVVYILGFFAVLTFGIYGPEYNAQAFIYGGF